MTRLVSWNVASLRARLPRVLELLAELRPDAVALQETKCSPEQLPRDALAEAGYRTVDHSAGPWNGVAILVREDVASDGGDQPLAGLPGEPDPTQARWIEADVAGLRVASVYVPNGKAIDHPDYARKIQFLEAMAARAGSLAASGPVVILGDMNVIPTDADVYDAEAFEGSTHVTEPERAALRGVLEAGDLVDAHVALHGPEAVGFTWWDYRGGSFHKNRGLRIDHALLDRATGERLRHVGIARDYRKGQKPSDHAPLVVDLADPAAG